MTITTENITIATPLASGKNIGESILKIKRSYFRRESLDELGGDEEGSDAEELELGQRDLPLRHVHVYDPDTHVQSFLHHL